MRRLFVVIAADSDRGVAVAAWGTAASAREAGTGRARARNRRSQAVPPLPADVKSSGRVGTSQSSATQPPFGYIGARSQNAGFDVEIAR